MAMLHSLKVYLGLGPDEEYDDSYLDVDDGDGYFEDDRYDDEPSPSPRAEMGHNNPGPRSNNPGPRSLRATSHDDGSEATSSVRPLRPVPSSESADNTVFTPRASAARPSTSAFEQDSSVRPVRVERSKPRTLNPESFGDAKIVADEFNRSTPVVMNMQGLSRELARRLIDFASGVCYVQGGKMEKVAPNVFLLTPKSVEVSDEDRRRLEERGFDRS